MINETKISADLLSAIDKIREELLKRIAKLNFSREDIIEIAGQLDFFEELKALGYPDLLEGYSQEYEKIAADIIKQARSLGVNVGASARDLDNYINVKFDELLGRASQYGKELKTELIKNIIVGTTPNEIALALSEIPLTNNQLKVAVNSGIAQFQRISVAKVFESKPEQRFYLDGPDDEKNRPACDAVLAYQDKAGYTKKEIDDGAITKIVKEHAEEFALNAKGEIIPSELKQALENEYTFADCGGFSCRHRWRPMELPEENILKKKILITVGS